MSKERYQVITTSSEEEVGLVTIEVPDYKIDREVSLLDLKALITHLKKLHHDPLIQVRTPEMTGSQLETLFAAGANGFTLLIKEEKKSNP